jgi:hypothetical protein
MVGTPKTPMEDENLPKPTRDGAVIPPASLTSKQEDLCKKLDNLHAPYSLQAQPGDMFRGTAFVLKEELRENPDLISQAANSLREILYPLWSKNVTAVSDKGKNALIKYGAVKINDALMGEIERIWTSLNDLTHHGSAPRLIKDFTSFTVEDFISLFGDFERVMFDALDQQMDVHKEIADIAAAGPPTE